MVWPFKKSRESDPLCELLPEGLVDIHCHVLPGLDDGPLEVRESVAVLDGLQRLGFERVIATPHFVVNRRPPVVEAQNRLIDEIVQLRGDRRPYLQTGAEILFDDHFVKEEATGRLPRIGPERVYLVELGLGPGGVPRAVEDVFFRFSVKGGTLVLAHPERYTDLAGNVERLDAIARTGVLLQVDLMSLTGKHGNRARRTARQLIEDGRADILASDVHSAKDLESLEQTLRGLIEWNREELIRTAHDNPLRILEGRLDEVVRRA